MTMMKYHTVLTIAGSDCSGGAGIQADIKTISALGCYAASVITAVTIQNTCGVTGIHPIPSDIVKSQIDAVMTDINPEAIKIGMINDVAIVKAIASSIKEYKPKFVVFDPVMVSTSGCKLIEDEAVEAIKNELLPLSTIITPNLSEAIVLTGNKINNTDDMVDAGKKIINYGCNSVLIKGGHLNGNDMCDVLCIKDDNTPYMFTSKKIDSRNTHGTGCTLSSAIATNLALGNSLQKAVENAKEYVYQGILNGKDIQIGKGHGPLNHLHKPIPMHIFVENE